MSTWGVVASQPYNYELLAPLTRRVIQDMSRARIVAGALIEGDDEGTDGDAGSWIKLVLMLEEVRALRQKAVTHIVLNSS